MRGRALWIVGAVCVSFGIAALAAPSGKRPAQRTWRLTGHLIDGSSSRAFDETGDDCWRFLRTTRSRGPVERRVWIRDGRYAPLEKTGRSLFQVPLAGAIFQTQPTFLAPFVSGVTADYTVDCTFKKGEVVLAPGPDHAAVLAWRSPIDGRISLSGFFENRQTCCGKNSRVNWYVERGEAPNLKSGVKSQTLAQGQSDSADKHRGVSRFELTDVDVRIGDHLYFIVDARADGTTHPHHGDATALNLQIRSNAPLPPPPTFENQIRPLLAKACGECHGAETKEAGLDLRSVSGMVYGGDSGSALKPGNLEQSYLWKMIASGEMPPEGEAPLSGGDKALIRRWILTGAASKENLRLVKPRRFVTESDRKFWFFQTPQRSPLPAIRQRDRATSPIDFFLLRRLEAQGLGYAPQASRTTLIRRLHFDLLGLPPTPAEVERFLADRSPDAYERLVDRLLASPRYGERWGRHWMDTVGYVDVRLYDGDATTVYPNEGMWRYRDYIIRSFNADKPYDLFLQEQLAGDEMVAWRETHPWTPEVREKLVATSYLRNIEDHTSEPQYGIERRYEVLFDLMSMVSTSMLGLTFECARCHNHKFDPIAQRDYYRLLSYFESSYNVHNWLKPQDRWLPDVGPQERAEIDRTNARIDSQRKALAEKLAKAKKAGDQAEVNRIEVERQLSQVSRRSYGKIQALFEVERPPTSYVLRRGNCRKPGLPVTYGIPEVLQPAQPSVAARPADTKGGAAAKQPAVGRRLQLARWITSAKNPATARVIMNRLWLHHFGQGIVTTPGNFGRNGARPSHPDLLDWLAVEFRESGWSLKRTHRLLLTSQAYRQSSRRSPQHSRAERLDPDNRLLWRQNLKRLESELIRDSILAVSGQLRLQAFGPPAPITKPVSGLSRPEAGPGAQRRSVYLFARRVYPLKFLEIFDAPIMAINCTRRLNSTTVLQSFAQLNSDFVIGAAQSAAERVLRRSGAADKPSPKAIRTAYRTILSREPAADELRTCREFLDKQTAAHRGKSGDLARARRAAVADLCHMLMCANEFLYVE